MSLTIRGQSEILTKPEVTTFSRLEAQKNPLQSQPTIQNDDYNSSFGDVKDKRSAVSGLVKLGGLGVGTSTTLGYFLKSPNAMIVGAAFTGVAVGAVTGETADHQADGMMRGMLAGAAAGGVYGALTMGKVGAFVGGITGAVTGALGAGWVNHSAQSGNLFIDRK